jgi:tetratricopeptide (TPR) repeat protein
MIKIHLAQIYYNTSYYDSPIDFLEEPSAFNEKDTPLGKLRSLDEIQEYLVKSKSIYIEHIRTKLLNIASWSGDKNCHLLAFPEYSVPPQVLLDLRELAVKYSMIIVAGTHRVQAGPHVESIYRDLKIYEDTNFVGCACSPIFCPDGTVYIAKKTKKSKWEPNLATPEKEPKSFRIDCKGKTISVSVIPCIDSLHADVIGKILSNKGQQPNIVICPSQSPSTSLFNSTANLLASRDTLFCYVNTADSGGSFYNIPEDWGAYLKGYSHFYEKLPSKTEAILELIVEHDCFYAKKGSLDTSPICCHPFPYPIIYTKESEWLNDVKKLRTEIIEWLKSSDTVSAIEWIDLFLSENLSKLPALVGYNIKYIRHNILPLYDGSVDTIEKSTLHVPIDKKVENTLLLWAIRVNDTIDILSKMIKEVPEDLAEDLFSCLKTQRKNRTKLPPVPDILSAEPALISNQSFAQQEFAGESEIIKSFQNRGSDIDQVRNYLANADNRVIIVTGAIGIGKSSFLNWMFKKQFGDWDVLRIYIAKEARAPRLLAEIGYLLGTPLDTDSLSTVTGNVFHQIARKIFTKFYQKQKRALVIDDLHDILKSGTARDHNQLAIMIEEAASCKQHVGGRIFIVSSQWLPWKWINQTNIAHLPLKRINDIYTRRIIEYHMRRCNLIKDESIPDPPQDLIDLVKGHPLSAKIVVDALQDKNFNELSSFLKIDEISGYVAGELLKHVSLSEDEKECLQLLSVFRKPIELNILKRVSCSELEKAINGLSTRCILNFDGKYLEMHEAVRRYFVSIIKKEKIVIFHNIAANYYQHKYEYELDLINKNPSIIAEFVHHLSLSEQIDKAKELKILIIEEIKPTARKFYKDLKQYSKAFELYRLLQKIVPYDVEVLAYIGRCNARLGQWNSCDQAFESAIEVARKTGQQVWWLYRDWGHIKARYNYFDEAKEYFDKASKNRPDDPSIKSSLAYMHWRQNEHDLARDLFEEVVNNNPYHKYTLTFYSRFLDETGEYDYAKILKERLSNLENDYEYRKPIEYDIDEDYDD